MENTIHIEKDFKFTAENIDATSTISKYIFDCWKHEKFCDIQISSRGNSFHVHKIVLAAHSEYFRGLLDNTYFVDSNNNNIILDDISSVALIEILNYFYCGKAEVTNRNIESLIIAADFLGVQTLKDLCEKYMVDYHRYFNAIQSVFFSYRYGLNNAENVFKDNFYRSIILLSKTSEFLSLPQNFVEYLIGNFDTTIKIYKSEKHRRPLVGDEVERELFYAVLHYISNNYAESNQTITNLLRCVKLQNIELNFIINSLANFPRIKNDDLIKEYIELSRSDKKQLSSINENINITLSMWLKCRKTLEPTVITSNSLSSGREVGRKNLIQHNTEGPYSSYVKSIVIISRLWDGREVIGGIQLNYWNGDVLNYGELTHRHKRYDITLKEDEVIVKFVLHAGFMIDSIKVLTNFGNSFGPFGGDGGGKKVIEPPSEEFFFHQFICESVITQKSRGIVMLSVVWLNLK